jgi:hypothetical protein
VADAGISRDGVVFHVFVVKSETCKVAKLGIKLIANVIINQEKLPTLQLSNLSTRIQPIFAP